MSLVLYPQQFYSDEIAPNTDSVLFGVQVPSDSELQAMWGRVHGIGQGDISVFNAVWIGMSIYLAQHADPDDFQSFETLWDEIVPKDNLQVPGAFNLDQATADSSPDFNLGEPDIQMLFDMGQPPNKLWERQQLISFASSPTGHHFTAGDQAEYWPTFVWDQIRVRKNVRVNVPSVLMAAVSCPDTPAQTTTRHVTSQNIYQVVKYMKSMLEFAWIEWMNLTETLDAPFENLATIIVNYLEPSAFIESATRMPALGFQVWSSMRAQIKVPGELSIGALSAG